MEFLIILKLVKDRKELSLFFSDFLQVALVSQVGTYMQVRAKTSASSLQPHRQPNCSPPPPLHMHTPPTPDPHPPKPHPHLTHIPPTDSPTPPTSHPHPTHTPLHLTHHPPTPHPHPTLYPPFPSRTHASMCVRCSSRNYTKDMPPVCKLPLSYLAILCLYDNEEDRTLKATVGFLCNHSHLLCLWCHTLHCYVQ